MVSQELGWDCCHSCIGIYSYSSAFYFSSGLSKPADDSGQGVEVGKVSKWLLFQRRKCNCLERQWGEKCETNNSLPRQEKALPSAEARMQWQFPRSQRECVQSVVRVESWISQGGTESSWG